MERRISLITLGVTDVARSTAFYEALGWRRSTQSQPDISFFHGPPALAVWSRDALAGDARRELGPPGGFGGVTVALNLGDRDEVDALVARAVVAGATVTKAPEPTEWGGYSGYVADPDGHAIEMAHNPFWPINPDGTVTLPD